MKILPPVRITMDDAIDRFKTLYRYKTELNDYPQMRDVLVEVATKWLSERTKALGFHIIALPKTSSPPYMHLMRQFITDGLLVDFPTTYMPDAPDCTMAAFVPNDTILDLWRDAVQAMALCIAAGEQGISPEVVLDELLKT